MPDAGVWLRLLAALGALALGAAAVVIVGVLAHRTPGPVASAASQAPAAAPATVGTKKPGFPAPPRDAVVFSRPDGTNVLALAVVPRRPLVLQASVVGQQGEGVTGLDVSFRVDAVSAAAEECGDGCYRATLATTAAPKLVAVHVAGGDRTTTWRVPMPRPWPPADASAIVARASRGYRSLRTLVVHDRLSSGQGHALRTRWTLVAPNRLSYQVENGPAAVIIGPRRWDKLPGHNWEESPQEPILQPTPFWVSWTDAHVLGSTKTKWHVSFFDPKTPGWYELFVAKRSMLPLDMRMNTVSHFMRQVYGSFNAPLRVVPPT